MHHVYTNVSVFNCRVPPPLLYMYLGSVYFGIFIFRFGNSLRARIRGTMTGSDTLSSQTGVLRTANSALVGAHIQNIGQTPPDRLPAAERSGLDGSPTFTQCTYIMRNGPCTKRGYGGRCHHHKSKTSHVACLSGCGRNTISQTGYCNKCGWHQEAVSHRMLAHQRKQAAEWDAYIDECMKSADLVIDAT